MRLIVAVLYAVCILAPHAALAVSTSAMHCLTESPAAHMHQEAEGAAAHMHADGAAHQHAAPAPEQMAPGGDSHAGMCCGLFCLTALAPASAPDSAAPSFAGLIVAGLYDALSGRSPERITRPPIA